MAFYMNYVWHIKGVLVGKLTFREQCVACIVSIVRNHHFLLLIMLEILLRFCIRFFKIHQEYEPIVTEIGMV